MIPTCRHSAGCFTSQGSRVRGTGVLLLTYRRGEGPTSTEAFPYDLDDATEA